MLVRLFVSSVLVAAGSDENCGSECSQGGALLQAKLKKANMNREPPAGMLSQPQDEMPPEPPPGMPPLPPADACGLKQLCPGMILHEPKHEVWEGRSCAHILENEGGWMCEEGKEGGAAYWKEVCCREKNEAPAGSCTLETLCPGQELDEPNHEVWEGRSCSHILENEGGWMCEEGKEEGAAYWKELCCRKKGGKGGRR